MHPYPRLAHLNVCVSADECVIDAPITVCELTPFA